MLTTARVDLPAPIAARLNQAAVFVDNVNDFAREDLVGFKRPIAAVFALVAPVTVALVYNSAGFLAMTQTASLVVVLTIAATVYVGASEWPRIVDEFQLRTDAKKKAIADLRCGFGESSFLSNGRSPRFFEYEFGVLVLADAGDLKTLFFNIPSDEDDPRWSLYINGELNRRVWRWLRLPVSREVVRFSTEGSKLAQIGEAPIIDSIEVWEAVNLALGEPLDGAIVHRPLDELAEAVERLL
ncbi:MAG: hypothetical protein AAGA09_03930 [Pseudomonadota bacterium]